MTWIGSDWEALPSGCQCSVNLPMQHQSNANLNLCQSGNFRANRRQIEANLCKGYANTTPIEVRSDKMSSTNPMPIEYQSSANLEPIQCQYCVNPMSIHYQFKNQSSVNPVPILCQSEVNSVPIQCQFSDNPVPILCQSSSNPVSI